MNTERTVFIMPNGLAMGGVTTWAAGMCRRLDGMGRRGVLLLHEHATPEPPVPVPAGVETLACPGVTPCASDMLAFADYRDSYLKCLPAVLVPNYGWGTYGVCAWLSIRHAEDMRVVSFLHTDTEEYFAYARYFEPVIHRFVAVSDDIARKLAGQLPQRAADIVCRPYAIALPEGVERAADTSGRPLQLVHAGRLTREQKRSQDIVPFVRALDAAGVDYRLRIIGDGDYRETLAAELAALGPAAAPRIRLEHALPPEAMSRVWAESDVCVLFSAFEGTSISMLEAMAHACVPVVTRVSGTAGLVRDGVNGALVDVGDVRGMAAAVARLATRRDLLATWGSAAALAVRERHDYGRYLAWYAGLCDELGREPPRRWPLHRPVMHLDAGAAECYRALMEGYAGGPSRWLAAADDIGVLEKCMLLRDRARIAGLETELADCRARLQRIPDSRLMRACRRLRRVWSRETGQP